MRIAVTGSTGKLGSVVARELRDRRVIPSSAWMSSGSVARTSFRSISPTTARSSTPSAGVDRAEPFDAVVHLGAIPAPGIRTDVATFHNNMPSTFNVFWAAVRLGIRRIVYASSETVLGLPFDVPPPYIPVDEDYPARPECVYSIVKVLEEQLATELVRWHPDLSITALRFSNVMWPEDYADFPSYDSDARLRKWNLWGYIDARDGAHAIERALEVAPPGFDRFIIAAADTVMSRPNAELIAEVFPDVPVTGEFGEHDTLLSITKARRLLGYAPQPFVARPRGVTPTTPRRLAFRLESASR